MAKARAGEATEKPVLRVIRRPDGSLDYKLPGEGQPWRRGHADMAALSQAAMKEIEPPYLVDFQLVDTDLAKAAPKRPGKG